MNLSATKAMMIGSAIGDALGVPVEFMAREELAKNPVSGMRGFGTHNQPPGTWSDDTSMTLCLLESIGRLKTIDYDDIMKNFVKWMKNAEFTATDKVFDIGITVRYALLAYAPESKLIPKTAALLCGKRGEHDNGNGSLMRIAPLSLYAHEKQIPARECLKEAHRLSCLTHAHPRSQMACGIYTLIAMNILEGLPLSIAITEGLHMAQEFYAEDLAFKTEVSVYGRLWNVISFAHLPEDAIKSSGYVVDTLEAVIWCLLNTTNYADCVLKAVNLGDDADTVGAIAGGLAGIAYGLEEIPQEWTDNLVRIELIDDLCQKFIGCIHSRNGLR